ncbi:tetratricopeptide repeat-containing sensor histidine kinase [Sphingobacterium faecale]|uniref:Tetratricopeptide repeat protein n=1 Tax=Sphingobacterium faecale TaxID=2803775 RepID=A0ABS1R1C5_9SPHI|nr:tetratricopeptide repeat protein [Sphingobacterium faecale]MBL1407842.1 tetratricopeptide repeat protein [Sphingobacterium faecale]
MRLKRHLNITVLTFAFLFLAVPQALASSPIDSLEQLLRAERDISKRVRLMVDLSRHFQKLKDKQDTAIQIATEAVEIASSRDSILYAHCLNNLGLLLRFNEQYKSALSFHTRAFHLIEHEDTVTLEKMIYANNAGVAARYNDSYDVAVRYYLLALRIAEAENDMRNIEIACNGLGNAYIAIPGREQLALEYLERALAIAKKEGNQRGIAIQYLTIGGHYNAMQQYGKAREYFRLLLEINEKIEDKKGIGISLKALANSYQDAADDLNLAEQYYGQALALFQEINDKLQQAGTLLRLGQLSYKQKQYAFSIKRLKQATLLAEQIHNKALLQATASTLASVYETMQNYPLALAHYKLSQVYQDSINLEKQNIEIASINRQYNIAKKESEIELLKANQSINEAQLSKHANSIRNRTIIILLFIALFITLAIVYVLQNRYRLNQEKTNKRLQEAERKHLKAVYEKNLAEAEILASQMRITPHFLFNCLNAIKILIQQNQNIEAIKYLVMLARFSRSVLETTNLHTHTLDEELDLIKHYIELEKNRFDNTFLYEIDNTLGDSIQAIELPPMLLQPFVENAIWHGLIPSESKFKKLKLSVTKTEDGACILIDDTGVGRFQAAKRIKDHKSRGTEITNKRIQLFNNTHTTYIKYHFIDKEDTQGTPLGTSIQIHIKNYQ